VFDLPELYLTHRILSSTVEIVDTDEAMKILGEAMDRARERRDPRAGRRRCDTEGHPSYQVVGRKAPTQVRCPRCRCTWAIGPKSEPTS